MKFRNLIFVLTIAYSAIFVFMLGSSYAYYVATNGATVNVTTGNIDPGVAVVFEQSQYINVNTGVPIDSSLADSLASASIFKITPSSDILSGNDVAINIGIADFSIDEALRVNDFKYKLSCFQDSNSDVPVLNVSGDGLNNIDDSAISSNYLKLGTMSTTSLDNSLVIGSTYTCTFRVWIEETIYDQNELMNKKFRGVIKVNTLFKKSEVVENE